MNKIIATLSLVLCLSAPAFAVTGTPGLPLPAVVEKQLNLNPGNPPASLRLGSQVIGKKKQVLTAIYDAEQMGGAAGATIILKDKYGGDAVLPDNAIAHTGLIDTTLAFTGTGSPTIALGFNTTTDIKSATAIASYTGLIAIVPVGTAATAVKMTAQRALVATLAGGTVLTGRFVVPIEYYLSE